MVRATPQREKGMALAIGKKNCVGPGKITGGVDTHADSHVAAALDSIGGLLGVESFEAVGSGYKALLAWLSGFGPVELVGVEGTGSCGAGLARHLTSAGVAVVEVDRSDRQDRRRQGKSDPLDAVSAARAALSGRARGLSKGRDGTVEAIRTLMVVKRSARGERTQTINQARAVIGTAPEDVRARLAGFSSAGLVAEMASLLLSGTARVVTRWATPPGWRYASWDAGRCTWPSRSNASTTSLSPSWPNGPPGCSPSTGWDRTRPRCC